MADVVDAPTNVSGYVPLGYPLPIEEIDIVVTLPPVIVEANVAANGVFITAENVAGFIGRMVNSNGVPSILEKFKFCTVKVAVGTTALAIEAVIVGVTSAGKFTSVFAVAVIGVTI